MGRKVAPRTDVCKRIAGASALVTTIAGCQPNNPPVESGDLVYCEMKVKRGPLLFPWLAPWETVDRDNNHSPLTACVEGDEDGVQACYDRWCTAKTYPDNPILFPGEELADCKVKNVLKVDPGACNASVARALPRVGQYLARFDKIGQPGGGRITVSLGDRSFSPDAQSRLRFNVGACAGGTCELRLEAWGLRTTEDQDVGPVTFLEDATFVLVGPAVGTMDQATGDFVIDGFDEVVADVNWFQQYKGDNYHGSVTVGNGSAPLYGNVDLAAGTVVFNGVFQQGDVTVRVDQVSGEIVNRPPVAVVDPNLEQQVACEPTQQGSAFVHLDASPSWDPDDNIESYTWRLGTKVWNSPDPVQDVQLPVGVHEFMLLVVDTWSAFSTDSYTVEVVDPDPPLLTVSDGEAQVCVPDFAPVTFPAAVAEDACARPEDVGMAAFVTEINGQGVQGAPSVVNIEGDTASATLPPGDHVVTWIAWDGAGNSTEVKQQVHVKLLLPTAASDPATYAGVCCPDPEQSLVLGTAEPDSLISAPAGRPVCMFGFGGADDMVSTDGDDRLYGGGGADTLFTRQGEDLVYASGGDDMVVAASALDVVLPGDGGSGLPGNVVYGGFGADTIVTGGRADIIHGGRGDDLITAGSGPDVIVPGRGVDVVDAGAGDDTIYIYDRCELPDSPGFLPFEVILCGPGEDQVVAPAPPLVFEDGTLKLLYVTLGCENVTISSSLAYRSECYWPSGPGGVVNP